MTETLMSEELGLPDFLVRRNLPDEYVGRRYLDDEEVAILSFLDNHGRISSTSSLMEFMLLLTRIDKMDHRILCLEILQNLLEPSQQKEFVAFGGYRLLKRWIKNAEDEDFVDELRLLVKLCLTLPFDSNAAKHSEIGKSIKRLQKHQSRSGHDVVGLYSDVQQLMDHWKEMVHQAAVLRQQQQQHVEDERKEQEKQQSLEILPLLKRSDKLSISTSNVAKEDTDLGIGESKSPEPMEVEEVPEKIIPTSTATAAKHIMEVDTPAQEVLPSAPSFQFKSGTSLRERKPLDMLEGARKLLAMRQQENTVEVSMDVSTVNNEKTNIQQQQVGKPMSKGGLKKRDNNGKREKLGVKWADEEGGLLREIQTIEVEKIKSSVATYKTHKDLVKKEKQLEKEVHLLKTESAMHKTTDWKVPKALNLSLEILDNIGVPSGSMEKDRQDQRLAHVLEVRYLDESLIPNDPDEDPNMYDIPLPDTLSTASISPSDSVIQPIPWVIAGSMEEEEETQPYNLNNNGYSGSTLMGSSLSSSLHTPAYDEYSFNTLLNSLPIGIQMLDPITLQMIAQNPQILSTLLTPDGQQVDESNLLLLQNSTSVEEYYSSILPSSSAAAGNSSFSYDYSSPETSQNWHHHGGLSGIGGNVVDSYQSWQSTSNSMEENLQLFMNTQSTFGSNSLQIPPSRDLLASLGVGNSTTTARTAAKFPTTKASTPCRFFNTPKGCINGDKCPFGHFLDTATSSIAISRSGPGHRPVGPGSRSMRVGDAPSSAAVGGNLLAARGMKRSRK